MTLSCYATTSGQLYDAAVTGARCPLQKIPNNYTPTMQNIATMSVNLPGNRRLPPLIAIGPAVKAMICFLRRGSRTASPAVYPIAIQ